MKFIKINDNFVNIKPKIQRENWIPNVNDIPRTIAKSIYILKENLGVA